MVTYPAWKNVDSSCFLEEIFFLDFNFLFLNTSVSIAKVESLFFDQLFEQEHEHLGIILEYWSLLRHNGISFQNFIQIPLPN